MGWSTAQTMCRTAESLTENRLISTLGVRVLIAILTLSHGERKPSGPRFALSEPDAPDAEYPLCGLAHNYEEGDGSGSGSGIGSLRSTISIEAASVMPNATVDIPVISASSSAVSLSDSLL